MTLTVSAVMTALRTVENEELPELLGVPTHRIWEVKPGNYPISTPKKHLVEIYLNIHPHASWEHLGYRLLFHSKHEALEAVKKKIKHAEGEGESRVLIVIFIVVSVRIRGP